MNNGDYTLKVDGTPIPLRRVENIRLVTPARDAYPATTAARLARSSRLAIDPTYPPDSLVVGGFAGKKIRLPSDERFAPLPMFMQAHRKLMRFD